MDTGTTSTLWSLRPAGEHAALRRAAQGAGFALRTLSLQRLVMREDGRRLGAALAAPIRLYTSPAAVRFAAAQAPAGLSRAAPDGIDIAVGSGTAAALRRAGVAAPRLPQRMDSEGVLALPELQALAGVRVGVITAPGGRGLLVPALAERGAEPCVAEVYARSPLRGGARRLAGFIADEGGLLLASSAEALTLLVARLPAAERGAGRRVRARTVVVSSARLAALAAQAGFAHVVVADGPTPAALVAAASRASPLQ